MTRFDVATASRTTLREAVVQELREAIVTGGLEPGRHLVEIDLSQSLGVSRGTLREALRSLQQEGLVSQDSRGRVSVKKHTPGEITDLYEVRTGLENMAMRRLCLLPETARLAVVAQLRSALEALRESQNPILEGLNADLHFHETMCRLAGNTVLYRSWINLSGIVRSTMIAAGPEPARANMAYQRHAPIVDFIEKGDYTGGSAFIAAHMEAALDTLLSNVEAGQLPSV